MKMEEAKVIFFHLVALALCYNCGWSYVREFVTAGLLRAQVLDRGERIQVVIEHLEAEVLNGVKKVRPALHCSHKT